MRSPPSMSLIAPCAVRSDLGVGLALGFGVRCTTERSSLFALSEFLGVGDGLAFSGSFALMIAPATNSRPHSNETIKRAVEMFILPG